MSTGGTQVGSLFVELEVQAQKANAAAANAVQQINKTLQGVNPIQFATMWPQAQQFQTALGVALNQSQQRAINQLASQVVNGNGNGNGNGGMMGGLRYNPAFIAIRQLGGVFGGQGATQALDVGRSAYIGNMMGGAAGAAAGGGAAALVTMGIMYKQILNDQIKLRYESMQYGEELQKISDHFTQMGRGTLLMGASTTALYQDADQAKEKIQALQDSFQKTVEEQEQWSNVWDQMKTGVESFSTGDFEHTTMGAGRARTQRQIEDAKVDSIKLQTNARQDYERQVNQNAKERANAIEAAKISSMYEGPAKRHLQIENEITTARTQLQDTFRDKQENWSEAADAANTAAARRTREAKDALETLQKSGGMEHRSILGTVTATPAGIAAANAYADAQKDQANTAAEQVKIGNDLKRDAHNAADLQDAQDQAKHDQETAQLKHEAIEAHINMAKNGYAREDDLLRNHLQEQYGINWRANQTASDTYAAFQKQHIQQVEDAHRKAGEEAAVTGGNMSARGAQRQEIFAGYQRQAEGVDRTSDQFKKLDDEMNRALADFDAITDAQNNAAMEKLALQAQLLTGGMSAVDVATRNYVLGGLDPVTARLRAVAEQTNQYLSQLIPLQEQYDVLTGKISGVTAATQALERSGLSWAQANAIAVQQSTNKWQGAIDKLHPMNQLMRDAKDIAQSSLSIAEKRQALVADIAENVPSNGPGQASTDYRASLISLPGLSTGYDRHGQSNVQGQILNQLTVIANAVIPAAQQVGNKGQPGAPGSNILGPPVPQ